MTINEAMRAAYEAAKPDVPGHSGNSGAAYPYRWELTQPGYMRLAGTEAVIGTRVEPFMGLPVDIVPGPTVRWMLLDEAGVVIGEGGA